MFQVKRMAYAYAYAYGTRGNNREQTLRVLVSWKNVAGDSIQKTISSYPENLGYHRYFWIVNSTVA